MRVMQESIEAPVPLMFDLQLLGVPVLVAGAELADEVVIVTETGRAVRYPLKQLRGSGTQAVRCNRQNRVTGAAVCQPGRELLLVTADGYGRKLRPEWIEIPEKENAQGKVQVARRSRVIGIASGSVWGMSNQRVVEIEDGRALLEDSTKTEHLLKLNPEEQMMTLYPV
jgi:DNA gyrase/topoisomerase IV subunit A